MCKIILAFADVQIIVQCTYIQGKVKRDFVEELPISMDKGGNGCDKDVVFSESETEAASVLAWPSRQILHVTSPWTHQALL